MINLAIASQLVTYASKLWLLRHPNNTDVYMQLDGPHAKVKKKNKGAYPSHTPSSSITTPKAHTPWQNSGYIIIGI